MPQKCAQRRLPAVAVEDMEEDMDANCIANIAVLMMGSSKHDITAVACDVDVVNDVTNLLALREKIKKVSVEPRWCELYFVDLVLS